MSPSEPVILVEKFPTALPAVPACVEIKPNIVRSTKLIIAIITWVKYA